MKYQKSWSSYYRYNFFINSLYIFQSKRFQEAINHKKINKAKFLLKRYYFLLRAKKKNRWKKIFFQKWSFFVVIVFNGWYFFFPSVHFFSLTPFSDIFIISILRDIRRSRARYKCSNMFEIESKCGNHIERFTDS